MMAKGAKYWYESYEQSINAFINIKDIKNSFNSYRHPEVLKGVKSSEEVYGDFLECLEIYKEYICNINNKNYDYMSFKEFLEFFDEISLYISNETEFEIYINNCWNLN